MLTKIRKYIYGFFNGLKNAEGEMFVSKNTTESESHYIQLINQNNLGEDLLKGEVTQEVEDLRYSTYTVDREAKHYEYIGDGVAIKKEKNKFDLNNFNFIQRNKIFCKSLKESFDDMNNGLDQFTLTFTYNDISRFKLERYVEYLDVSIKNGIATITLRFNKDFDLTNPITRMFYNELIKIQETPKNAFYENLNSICFTTYKAQGEDDLIMYSFSDLNFKRYEFFDSYVNITFTTTSFSREDLMNKFFSENQKVKYDTKAVKTKDFQIGSDEIEYRCDECGQIINKYDYSITKCDFGKGLCEKCLVKYLTL